MPPLGAACSLGSTAVYGVLLGGEADEGGLRMPQMDCIEEGLEDVISIGHGNRGPSALARRRYE